MAIFNHSPYLNRVAIEPQTRDHKSFRDFVQKYNVRELYAESNPGSLYGNYYSDPYQQIVNISLSKPAFDHLIKNDHHSDEVYQQARKEAMLRSRYPALQNAWDQYQMLLALMEN